MWDKIPTFPQRMGHPFFDWSSDGSCNSQVLSQLQSAKLAQLLPGTIYSSQITVQNVQFKVYSSLVVSLYQLVPITHGADLSWITASYQLLLGENTLQLELGGRGGRGGILQLLLILTTGGSP